MNIKLRAAGDVAAIVAIAAASVSLATYIPYGNYIIVGVMCSVLLYVMWTVRVTMLAIENRDSQ